MAWLPHVVTVEPATEPVTVGEGRVQCRVDGTDHDAALTAYLKSARRFIERHCGIKLVTQTVALRCDSFDRLRRLPIAPVQGIASIKYLDTDGAEQTLDPAVYEGSFGGLRAAIRTKIGQSWPVVRPVDDAVRLELICGYGVAADVPDDLKQALLLICGEWFANREDTNVGNIVSPMPNSAATILAPFRMY